MRLVIVLAASLLAAWPQSRLASAVQDQQTTSGQESSPAQAQADQQKSPSTATAPENPQAGAANSGATNPAPVKSRKHRRPHKTTQAGTPSETGTTKTVVRNGGVTDPSLDLSPGLSQPQASHQIQSTSQLLSSADANLKKISGRQLSPAQQDTLKQIKNYMQDAREATAAGDVHRAYNLAVKANLLAAELAGN